MYHNIIDFQLQCETTHYLCNAPPPPLPGGGISPSLHPKSLTLAITKICDIPYPIYDLTKHSKPCFFLTRKSKPCF